MEKYGYLREKNIIAENLNNKYPNDKIGWTGLSEYLKEIYPNVNDWVTDKIIPKDLQCGSSYKYRPDFRSQQLKMIIEFDGLQHYSNPTRIDADKKRDDRLAKMGYKVIRIPFFIQLTRTVIKEMFNVDINNDMFQNNIPSFGINLKDNCAESGCPSYLCRKGLIRMANDFTKYPEQYEINIKYLKENDPEDNFSDWKVLEKYYNEIKKDKKI